MGTRVFPHPTNEFKSTAQADLGQLFSDGEGREFLYVKFNATDIAVVAATSGIMLYVKDGDGGEVTTDFSASVSSQIAGALPASERTATQGVPTATNVFGFAQIKGLHPACEKAAANDTITPGAVMKAVADSVCVECTSELAPTAAESVAVIGRTAGASEDTATGTYNEDTVPVNLDIPAWGPGAA